jgi:hypothetical protein
MPEKTTRLPVGARPRNAPVCTPLQVARSARLDVHGIALHAGDDRTVGAMFVVLPVGDDRRAKVHRHDARGRREHLQRVGARLPRIRQIELPDGLDHIGKRGRRRKDDRIGHELSANKGTTTCGSLVSVSPGRRTRGSVTVQEIWRNHFAVADA